VVRQLQQLTKAVEDGGYMRSGTCIPVFTVQTEVGSVLILTDVEETRPITDENHPGQVRNV
jgi:hypothetical protein